MRPSKAVKSFKGLQQSASSALVSMDSARDSINCIVSPQGFLEKMRVPIPVSAPVGQVTNASFFDYQRADGLRQLIVTLGTQIISYEGDYLVPTVLDDNPLNQAEWSMVESNNILFMANGNRMLKWTGTALQPWGIQQPAVPRIGADFSLTGAATLTRAANVVTLTGGVFASIQGNLWPFAAHVGDIIQVSNVSDPSFNGFFSITAVTPNLAWSQPVANATVTIPAGASFNISYIGGLGYYLGTVTITRTSGFSVALVGAPFAGGWEVGGSVIVTGYADTTFNGTFVVTAVNIIAGTVTWAQAGFPDAIGVPGGSGTITPGLSNSLGISWRYAYGNSVTGHVGPASDPITATAVSPGTNHRIYTVNAQAPNPADSQIDTIYWFRTLDGGGDYFLLYSRPISQLWINDSTIDGVLDTTTKAPLLNYQPPVGKYLSKWQGRIFIAGITGAPQDIAYSGYERIFLGRPEESYPPNNRLRLSVGADDVRAMGAIQQGLVAWSHSNEMFVLRGTVEDITVTAPVAFSAYLEQLPWNQGANSHYAVRGTPYGIVWYASDNSIEIWNGSYFGDTIGPKDVGESIYPLLWRVTETEKPLVKSAWLNYLEREWYIMLLPIDGAMTNNRMVFIDMTPGDNNAGIFISDVQADAVGTREDSRGATHLMILQNGVLLEIAFASFAQNGMLKKKGLDRITGYTVSTVVGPPNPIPAGTYFMRLVKIANQGGETAMSDEIGPLSNGGTQNVYFTNIPADPDVQRWRIYFGTVSGQLTQYVDTQPPALYNPAFQVACSGTPRNFLAPLQRRLPAFWKAGWFGNDTPENVKMFRDGHLVTSQTGFKLTAEVVDDESYTFDNPLQLDCPLSFGSRYGVNMKGRRMSPTVQFPDADFPATVIELSASMIPGGQR